MSNFLFTFTLDVDTHHIMSNWSVNGAGYFLPDINFNDWDMILEVTKTGAKGSSACRVLINELQRIDLMANDTQWYSCSIYVIELVLSITAT